MRIFTRVNGEIQVWETNVSDPAIAIQLVKKELGLAHKSPVLALVKF